MFSRRGIIAYNRVMTAPPPTHPPDEKIRRLTNDTRLIWCDLEMSGLVPESDLILEAAFIVTDGHFKILAESESWAVHQPDSVLDAMDDWNRRTHRESGLTRRCQQSQMNIGEVERAALDFMRAHCKKRESPICGNSICQDRRFMAVHMPKVEDYFHYRNFDVSVFKIYAQLHRPDVALAVEELKTPDTHRALSDIRDSIREMKFYRERLFSPMETGGDNPA